MTAHAERESAHERDLVDATATNTIARRLIAHGWTRGQLTKAIYGPHAGGSWAWPEHVSRQVADRMAALDGTPPPKPKLTLADRWTTPDWYPQAKCRGEPTSIFYLDRGASTDETKAICAACPVRAECLELALVTGEKHGIWGGLAEKQRRRIRRQRRTTSNVA